MTLPLPSLDEKSWEEIFEEARARIPRTAPDWTDWNAHDPGITFLELFAWLAEMQRFRLQRASPETRRRFVGLAGLTPEPLRPARVRVDFDPMPPGDGRRWLLLPADTPVTTRPGHGRSDAFGFQVARDAFLTANRLRRVVTDLGDRRLDHTEANGSPEVSFPAFGTGAPVGAALELEFGGPFRAPEFEIWVDLHEDDLDDLPSPGAGPGREVPPHPRSTAVDRPPIRPSVELAWEHHDGAAWRPLSVLEDGSSSFYRPGRVRFVRPDPAADSSSRSFRIRCRVAAGRFEIPPRLRALRLNVVDLVQVETELNEALGRGDGRPDQTFRLAHGKVLETGFARTRLQVGDVLDWDGLLAELSRPEPAPWATAARRALTGDLRTAAAIEDGASPEPPRGEARDLLRHRVARAVGRALGEDDAPSGLISDGRPVIEVGRETGDGRVDWERWERVDDFRRSGPADRHYVLDPAAGGGVQAPDAPARAEVRFGNGLNGRAPGPDDLVRARFYRHTRGALGNLPAGRSWSLSVQGVRLTGVNVRAAAGGRDPEAIEDAGGRARKSLRAPVRGVTSSDLEQLALHTPGLRVARARALVGHDPVHPGLHVPGSVTVVVVPRVRRDDDRAPVPGQGFLATVGDHLERHRVITASLHVIAPAFVRFGLSARIFLARRSSPARVRERLERELRRFFDPLHGGAPPGEAGAAAGGGWPLGRPIHPSEVYERIDAVAGVDYTVRVRLKRIDADRTVRRVETDAPLQLRSHELPDFSWEASAGELELIAFGEKPEGEADADPTPGHQDGGP